MWYAPLGFALAVIVGLAVSNLLQVLTKKIPRQMNSDLFTPMVANRIRNRINPVNMTAGCQNNTDEAPEPDTIQSNGLVADHRS